MLKVARKIKPHTIVTLGDYGDFYCTSRHPKDPNRQRDLQYEIDSCEEGLDELDSLGAEEKVFISGNHEDNLARYLVEKAPELFNVVKVEKLLKLKERGWKYIPYKDHVRVGKIYFTHDTGPCGQNAHLQSAAKFGSNLVIGHTHRCAVAYKTTVTGREYVAAMVGWLGDKKKAEYMHKVNTTDWMLGFGIGFQKSNGVVHVRPCPIIDYEVEVNGAIFKG
jgi:hypothetical protein